MKDAGEKTKVLLVAVSPDRVGGQAIQAKRLLDAFQNERDVEFSFVPTDPRLSGLAGRLQKIKFLRTIVNSIEFWRLLFREVPRADVVHAFSASYSSYLISTLPPLAVAKIFGKPAILNYHSGEAADHLRRARFFARKTMRLFDRIIVPSNFLVDVFGKFGMRAEAISNFVETEKIKFRPRDSLRPVFLSNRNLESLYNVGCTLRAFAEIQQKFPAARLTVAGAGTERAKLETLARELKLQNVEFVGAVAPDEMPEFYDRADVYLNSSNIDNMPLSLIEAFCAGLPVVTTNAGGIPHLVKHEETGLLVEPDDCRALARQATKLLENPALAQKIIANARLQAAQYSQAQARRKWLDAYADLNRKSAVVLNNKTISPNLANPKSKI